jgi:hypothetical protein
VLQRNQNSLENRYLKREWWECTLVRHETRATEWEIKAYQQSAWGAGDAAVLSGKATKALKTSEISFWVLKKGFENELEWLVWEMAVCAAGAWLWSGSNLKVYIFLSWYSSSSRLETMSSNYRAVPRSFRYITGQMWFVEEFIWVRSLIRLPANSSIALIYSLMRMTDYPEILLLSCLSFWKFWLNANSSMRIPISSQSMCIMV